MPAPHPVSVVAHQLLDGHPAPPPWRDRIAAGRRPRRAARVVATAVRLARAGGQVVVRAWTRHPVGAAGAASGPDGRPRMT